MRLFFLAFLAVISAIYWQFGHQKEKISHFFGMKRALTCDTTHVPRYSVYDLAYLVRSNFTLNYNNDKIIYLIENEDSTFSKILYDKNENYLGLQSASGILNSFEDSTAFKALILSENKLYNRWEKSLATFRANFVKKREFTLENLQESYPQYRFKVNIDMRAMDNQAQLLQKGRTVTAISQHQFGLASDIAIFKGKYYLQKGSSYHMLGTESVKNNLYWGGDLVGMPDPNHIQYFKNSADLLSKIPALKFEFAPYLKFYEKRVADFTQKGKAHLVQDSDELLQIIEVLDENKLCGCKLPLLDVERIGYENLIKNTQNGVLSHKDFLLIKKNNSNSIALIDSTLGAHKIVLGTWR